MYRVETTLGGMSLHSNSIRCPSRFLLVMSALLHLTLRRFSSIYSFALPCFEERSCPIPLPVLEPGEQCLFGASLAQHCCYPPNRSIPAAVDNPCSPSWSLRSKYDLSARPSFKVIGNSDARDAARRLTKLASRRAPLKRLHPFFANAMSYEKG